jgi:hypothetical protein
MTAVTARATERAVRRLSFSFFRAALREPSIFCATIPPLDPSSSK